jgi:hypothetical protein
MRQARAAAKEPRPSRKRHRSSRIRRCPLKATPGMRDHAHTLSDFRVPYGDAKLPELRHPKARSQSIHDRCKVGEDSRFDVHPGEPDCYAGVRS